MRTLPLSFLLLATACHQADKTITDTDAGFVDPLDEDLDGDGYVASEDCDDNNTLVHPGAEETCDGIDNNCDDAIDEGVTSTYYADNDGDGFGDPDDSTEACEAPTGTVAIPNDCDDTDGETYPGAAERCDEADNDCDGEVDEAVQTVWFGDADRDGYGDPDSMLESCNPPNGYTDNDEDCDDLNAMAFPDATEVCDEADNDCDGAVDEDVTETFYQDADGDGFGLSSKTTEGCSLPTGYAAATGDCDDTDGTISPNATELCDGVDNDCDGVTDEDDAADASTWYADADGDGHGDASDAAVACAPASGRVADSTDCDDGTSTAHPGAAEICDGIDNDCDGDADEATAIDASTWYADNDGDGYGGTTNTVSCDMPTGYADNSSDCDDGEPLSNPGETEVCDGIDNDCDGDIDEAVTSTYFLDYDGDGYGDASRTATGCSLPSGYSADNTDCDDTNASANPTATEVCDEADNDCDGTVDEGVASVYYVDDDSDGYGDASGTTSACSLPSNHSTNSTDCDDTAYLVNPGETEVCDGIDNDCDELVDDDDTDVEGGDIFYADGDGDGYGDPDDVLTACVAPTGYVDDDSDCAPDDPDFYPESDGSCAQGISCGDIFDRGLDDGDGTYTIDPDGSGTGIDPFSVYCDMTTDGGGWTLVGSFNNNDSNFYWTKYGYDTDYLDNWTNETTFGSLADRETEDFKSPAFWQVDATDLMAMDSNNEWASYDDSLTGSLADTLASYTSCQDKLVTGVSVDSSDSTVATYGQIAFYGADPNHYDSCPLSYYTDGTDSAVISLAGTGCGTTGFGHLGYLSSSGHEDRDFRFCLGSSVSLSSAYSCGYWKGVNMIGWFDETYCDYAMLYVR